MNKLTESTKKTNIQQRKIRNTFNFKGKFSSLGKSGKTTGESTLMKRKNARKKKNN